MVNVVKGQSQRQSLSDMVKHFLHLAMGLHFPISLVSGSRRVWEICICTAQSFISDVTSKRDILQLNGLEISNILAAVNVLFEGREKKKSKPVMSSRVYVSCCDIIISLIKHYPKHLYGCSPPFVSTIRSLFREILFSGEQVCSATTDLKIQEFTKVCELLSAHKEVFKKHSVGFIIDYVNKLQSGIDSSLKNRLIPAVYSLLDMLSIYETQQMNTLMNPTTKAIFRTLFQNYQKSHQYKGQF